VPAPGTSRTSPQPSAVRLGRRQTVGHAVDNPQRRADPRPAVAPRHRLPDHHRGRQQELWRAGSIPSCNAARISSWTRPRRRPFTTFEPSPFVWVSVVSRPVEDRAIADAGL